MRLFALSMPMVAAVALVAAGALPARAATPLVIAGEGRPRVPSQYLSVETARTLPSGENTLALGFGAPANALSLTYARGIGWGELALNMAAAVPAFASPSAAIGYKWPVGWLGPWDTAVLVQGGYGGPRSLGALVGLPLDAQFGPGVLTLQPRVALPDLANGASRAIAALQAGYAWPLGGGFSLFGEGAIGYQWAVGFLPEAKAGLRYSPTSALAVDVQVGAGAFASGLDYTQPQNGQASVTVRCGF